jgi:hypothetical protein
LPHNAAMIGSGLVMVALVCYSAAIVLEQTRKTITTGTLALLTCGALFDITATAFMIAGSTQGPFTVHGLLGYSSLALMLVVVVICWRLRMTNRSVLPRAALVYSRIAYGWWMIAFVTGVAIVLAR